MKTTLIILSVACLIGLYALDVSSEQKCLALGNSAADCSVLFK